MNASTKPPQITEWVGVAQVCALAGFSRQALQHHRTGRTSRPFPPPGRHVGRSPEWLTSVVKAWIDHRQPPGRPRKRAETEA